jgi:transposase
MRFSTLTPEEKETLEQGYRNHPKFHVRQRFHSILLSNDGWQVKDIAKLYNTRTRTIYTWMDRWRNMGIVGLMILPGRGLKPCLSITDKNVVDTVKKNFGLCAKPT